MGYASQVDSEGKSTNGLRRTRHSYHVPLPLDKINRSDRLTLASPEQRELWHLQPPMHSPVCRSLTHSQPEIIVYAYNHRGGPLCLTMPCCQPRSHGNASLVNASKDISTSMPGSCTENASWWSIYQLPNREALTFTCHENLSNIQGTLSGCPKCQISSPGTSQWCQAHPRGTLPSPKRDEPK